MKAIIDGRNFRGRRAGGADYWRGMAQAGGVGWAAQTGRQMLFYNMRSCRCEEELEFLRGIFLAMFEEGAGKPALAKTVYPYPLDIAIGRMERTYFEANRELNGKCARSIGRLIDASRIGSVEVDFELAAMKTVLKYGFPRAGAVLASICQGTGRCGNLSAENIDWARRFALPDGAVDAGWLYDHAVFLDRLCRQVRKLYADLDAKRFDLPGAKEHGGFNCGYEITRAAVTSNDIRGFVTGFAIGHNPAAASPWACWQFIDRGGGRHYSRGIYGSKKNTADTYSCRVFVALS